MSSKRLNILKAFDTTLANIDGTGDYNNTLVRHSHKYFTISDLGPGEFPATTVAPGIADFSMLTNCKYTSGPRTQDEGWIVSTIGYVSKDTQEDLSEACEDMIEDMLRAILNNDQLGLAGSEVHQVILKRIMHPFYGLRENAAAVEIFWAVKYDFSKTDL